MKANLLQVLHHIGYDRYKLKGQKGYSLKIKKEEADVIKLIFQMYADGNGLQSICNVLNDKKILPPASDIWRKSTIRAILRKEVYIGKIKYIDQKRTKKVIDGQIKKVINPNPIIYITQGLHEAIIDNDLWDKVQVINQSHLKTPTTHIDRSLKNPLSSILMCEKCGRPLRRIIDTRRCSDENKNIRLICSYCDNISSTFNSVEDKLMDALKELLKSYKLQILDSSDTDINIKIKVLENTINQNLKEIDLAEKQRLKIFDLLEQGIYDNNTFLDRSQKNASKIVELKENIKNLESEKAYLLKLNNNQQNIIPRIENIIDTYYTMNNATAKNKLLKTAIEKVTYLKENPKSPNDFELTIYPLF